MKKAGVVADAAAVVLAILLAVTALSGCSKSEEPAPAPEPVQEAPTPEPEAAPADEPAPEPEKAKLSIPNQYFLTGVEITPDGRFVNRWGLGDLEGNQVPFENPDMWPEGGFAEGRILVSWETSDYDEEWDTEFNNLTHYALVDQTGKIVKDLTDLVHSFDFYSQGTFRCAEVEDNPTYVDGRMVLRLGGLDGPVFVVLDEQGNVKFTMGYSDLYQYADEGTVPVEFDIETGVIGSATSADNAYHDGVLCIGDRLLVDSDGEILAQNEDYLESLGYGYMLAGYDADKVVDYSGNVLFDVNTINVPGDIENARLFARDGQPGASGIVSVVAEKVNPHGGDNKNLAGLYCISTQKWLVPLQEGDLTFGTPHEGLIWVSVDSKNHILEGYGATDDDRDRDYSCLMDIRGNIVADGSTASLEEDGEPLGGACPTYLKEGYWLFRGKPGVVAYIENGVIKGTASAPEHGITIEINGMVNC